jgi:hypothetical protein
MKQLSEQERLLLARFDPRQMSLLGEEHEAELRRIREYRINQVQLKIKTVSTNFNPHTGV